MYTSVWLLALVVSQPSNEPNWFTDYPKAQDAAKKAGRPLAVFLGSGASGYKQVSRDGSLNAPTRKALAQNYVCVYVDTSSPGGRKLAQAFEITKGRGLVISDRSGRLQAFHHDGDLPATDLARRLETGAKVQEVPAFASAPRAATQYVTFSASNFSTEVLKSEQPVLVDFWAEWCGPCRRMEPVVAGLANEFSGKAKIGKLDIDAHRGIAQQYQVTAIPTLLIFRNGQVVDRIVGVMSQSSLASRIRSQFK